MFYRDFYIQFCYLNNPNARDETNNRRYNGFDYNIASIFGQDQYGRNGCFTDYDALRKAMEPIRVMATPFPAYPLTTVRIPYKMGCGLGGGDWSIVLSIIQEELVDRGIPVEIWRL